MKKYNKIMDVSIPILYLGIWLAFVFFCKRSGFFDAIDATSFLIVSFLVMFFSMITKSTSWGIGNKFFNIKGSSERHIEYSWHENWENGKQKSGYTITIDHDNPEVIKQLMTHHHCLVSNREDN